MEIIINPLETAEEFAHAAVKHEFLDFDVEGEEHVDEASLYLPLEDGQHIQAYRPDVQDAYNRHFDYFFEILTNNEKQFDFKKAYTEPKTILFVSAEMKNVFDTVAIKYDGLGLEPIYEINGKFYILKPRV